jgi:hypothetical protein
VKDGKNDKRDGQEDHNDVGDHSGSSPIHALAASFGSLVPGLPEQGHASIAMAIAQGVADGEASPTRRDQAVPKNAAKPYDALLDYELVKPHPVLMQAAPGVSDFNVAPTKGKRGRVDTDEMTNAYYLANLIESPSGPLAMASALGVHDHDALPTKRDKHDHHHEEHEHEHEHTHISDIFDGTKPVIGPNPLEPWAMPSAPDVNDGDARATKRNAQIIPPFAQPEFMPSAPDVNDGDARATKMKRVLFGDDRQPSPSRHRADIVGGKLNTTPVTYVLEAASQMAWDEDKGIDAWAQHMARAMGVDDLAAPVTKRKTHPGTSVTNSEDITESWPEVMSSAKGVDHGNARPTRRE